MKGWILPLWEGEQPFPGACGTAAAQFPFCLQKNLVGNLQPKTISFKRIYFFFWNDFSVKYSVFLILLQFRANKYK